MMTSDGVADAVIRRSHWRGALLGVGLALGVGLLTLLAPQPAHADDDGGLLDTVGSVVNDVASTASTVVDPVVTPLPDARELPVVGGIVGEVADSRPVATLTAPVTGIVDGVLGAPVLAPLTEPVTGLVDGTLAQLAGAPGAPDAPGPATAPAAEASRLAVGVAATASPLLISSVDELGIVVATGAEGPRNGPVSVPGGLTPTSAVTASGPPIGLAAAVLGAGLLLLLARGRLRPGGIRAPLSPVYDTDTSPD